MQNKIRVGERTMKNRFGVYISDKHYKIIKGYIEETVETLSALLVSSTILRIKKDRRLK